MEALATLGSLGHASVLQEVLSALLSVYSGLCNVDADWHSRDPSCHRDLKEVNGKKLFKASFELKVLVSHCKLLLMVCSEYPNCPFKNS